MVVEDTEVVGWLLSLTAVADDDITAGAIKFVDTTAGAWCMCGWLANTGAMTSFACVVAVFIVRFNEAG